MCGALVCSVFWTSSPWRLNLSPSVTPLPFLPHPLLLATCAHSTRSSVSATCLSKSSCDPTELALSSGPPRPLHVWLPCGLSLDHAILTCLCLSFCLNVFPETGFLFLIFVFLALYVWFTTWVAPSCSAREWVDDGTDEQHRLLSFISPWLGSRVWVDLASWGFVIIFSFQSLGLKKRGFRSKSEMEASWVLGCSCPAIGFQIVFWSLACWGRRSPHSFVHWLLGIFWQVEASENWLPSVTVDFLDSLCYCGPHISITFWKSDSSELCTLNKGEWRP